MSIFKKFKKYIFIKNYLINNLVEKKFLKELTKELLKKQQHTWFCFKYKTCERSIFDKTNNYNSM